MLQRNLVASIFHTEGTQALKELMRTDGQFSEVGKLALASKSRTVAETTDVTSDAKPYHRGREISVLDAGDVACGIYHMARIAAEGMPHGTVDNQTKAAIDALPGGKPLIIAAHSLRGNLGELVLIEALLASNFSSISVIPYGTFRQSTQS